MTAEYRVSLALYGHNHRYERISAAFGNKTVLASVPEVQGDGSIVHVYHKPNATVHAVVGAAGAGFSEDDCHSRKAKECVPWSEQVIFEHGYARFNVLNSTVMEWEYVGSTNGSVLDKVRLVQDLAVW